MAFPGNGIRYVIGGTLPSGEVWSTGVYGSQIGNPNDLQALADGQVQSGSLFLAVVGALRPMLPAGAAVTSITCYRYESGRQATGTATAAVATGGGTGTVVHPNSMAMCVTLRTALANRRGRGRMFFPASGLGLTASALFATNQVTNLLTPLGAWLDQINAEVWSTVGTTKNRVSRIDADLVPDDISSRRDRLRTPRQTVTIATPD